MPLLTLGALGGLLPEAALSEQVFGNLAHPRLAREPLHVGEGLGALHELGDDFCRLRVLLLGENAGEDEVDQLLEAVAHLLLLLELELLGDEVRLLGEGGEAGGLDDVTGVVTPDLAGVLEERLHVFLLTPREHGPHGPRHVDRAVAAAELLQLLDDQVEDGRLGLRRVGLAHGRLRFIKRGL